MSDLRRWLALFLVINVLVGLTRAVRGPTLADRILVTQLFGTTAVAVLLLLSAEPGGAPLRDVALVFAVLSTVTVFAFVRVSPTRREP